MVKSMRTTIKDIADYCKVSVGTVDRALNNRPGISKETKEKVLQSIETLNYHRNHTGRSLAMGKTKTIGVVCFDLYNNFFPELIDTIEARAKERGYFIYLILTHKAPRLEKDGLSYLCERQVDGIILFPIGVSREYIASLRQLGIPIVTIYNRLTADFPFVDVNGKKAMEDAVAYIASKGSRRICYMTPEIEAQESEGLNTYTLRQREAGYLSGIQQAGLERAEVYEKGSAEEKTEQFVKSYVPQERTALLCLCDSYALRVMRALSDHGIRVPEQVGVMGFDNIASMDYMKPRMTTIAYSVKEMGCTAIDMLFQCMEDPEYRRECLLDYRIVEGGTLL